MRYAVYRLVGVLVLAVLLWWGNALALERARSAPLATHDKALSTIDKVTVVAGTQGTTIVPKYGLFELTLTAAGNYPNPYLLMPGDSTTPGFVVGTFTGSNGEIITLDGFWDGGTTWKIRMVPTAAGAWSYTTASTDPGLDSVTGSFTCSPSTSKGFLRVDPNHPHHFMWDDGTPFYWAPVATMIAHFDNRDALGNNRRVDNGTFQTFLDVRAAQGFNVTEWGYYGFNKPQFNEETQQNEGGPPFTNYEPDLLNPAYHQYGDQRVEALLERGIIPQFQLGWPDQGILSNIGHTSLKRYWRYLIARYAAYNITYNLFGQIQEFGSNYLTIANDYGQLTRTWDPYNHLLTTHTVGDLEPAFANQPWLDYITLPLSTTETSDYLGFGKPVINAEYGGHEDEQVTGEALRPLIWDVRMRGGYFVYESWGNDLQSTGAQYAKLNNLFFRDRTRFWLLEYHPELFGGTPGLADPGQEYVVYLPSGGSVTVDLSAVSETLDVEWYNPRTSEFTPAGTTTGGSNQSFTPPFSGDAVLHIKSDLSLVYLPVIFRSSQAAFNNPTLEGQTKM
jgi:hypothetical protein